MVAWCIAATGAAAPAGGPGALPDSMPVATPFATPDSRPDATPVATSGPTVVDDTGRTVALAAPARLVVALTPALVELAFAVGGGDRLVAAVAYSDEPPAARALPRIGDAVRLDLERVLALAPDLILAWEGGTAPAVLARVAALGVPVYASRIQRLDDIPTTLDRLAVLFGLPPPAAAAAARDRIARLASPAAAGAAIPVFYQVWARPLMTVNGHHVVSDILARCGGANVFADLAPSVPQVTTEAVVTAAPRLMLAGSPRAGGDSDGSLDGWRRFPTIPAVADDALVYVPADWLSRPGPRLLDAAEAICRAIAVRR